MPREELSPDYASPGMRWGMFLIDHPNGKEKFYKATAVELNIDEDFAGETGEFVVAEIDARDGSDPSIGYKEIPKKVEKYVSGRKQEVDFERDPETWQTLCTKALGRALKRFGYPDNVRDLRAVMAWRRSTAELQAALEGRVLQLGSGKKEGDEIVAAGSAETDDNDDVIDTTATDKPRDAAPPESQNLDDVDNVKWHPELIDMVDVLAKSEPAAIDAILEFCKARDIDPFEPGVKMKMLKAFVDSRMPKESKPKAEPQASKANIGSGEPAGEAPPDTPPPDPATLLGQRQAALEEHLDNQTPEGLERVSDAISKAGISWPPADLDTCAKAEEIMEKLGELKF